MPSAQIAWHTGQYAEPKRSTLRLREFVTRVLADEDRPTEVLDAATGAGANMLQLADLFPAAHWTGIDLAEDLLEIGRERLDPKRFTMLKGDILSIEQDFGPDRFDVSFLISTLLALEDYERALEQLLATTRKCLFILSLFSDSALDAFVHMVGRLAGSHEGTQANYNIYSLPRFREFCRQLGAAEIVAEPFEIDIDIPRPTHGTMGTWTELMADGRRRQFSGPLAMSWWFVAIRP